MFLVRLNVKPNLVLSQIPLTIGDGGVAKFKVAQNGVKHVVLEFLRSHKIGRGGGEADCGSP